jgi:hypothetical protein
VVHINISGPWPVATPEGMKYFICFLDDSPHHGYGFLAKAKSESYECYILVEVRIRNKTGKDIGCARFDNAKEFIEGRLAAHLRAKGTKINTSAPYAHPQNGKIERYLRVIQDRGFAMMAHCGLPPSFWGHAILYSVYITNRLPTSTLPPGITPHEASEGVKPDLSTARVFGCRCFPLLPDEPRRKNDFRRYEAIFLGFGPDSNNWKVMDMKGRVTISHDVVFDEETMGKLSSRRFGLTYRSPTADMVDARGIVERIPPLIPRRSARLVPATTSPPPSNSEVALRRSPRHHSSTVTFAEDKSSAHSSVFLTSEMVDMELSRAEMEVLGDMEVSAYLGGLGL